MASNGGITEPALRGDMYAGPPSSLRSQNQQKGSTNNTGEASSLTMRKAPHNHDRLKSSFLLICRAASALGVRGTAINLTMSPLPASLVRIQNVCNGCQHSKPDPHFLFLLVSNNLGFQRSKRRHQTGRRR